MTPYPLIPPKVYPLVAPTKNNGFDVYLNQNSSQNNFYFNYHIEANQVNFSPFSRFELRTPGVHYFLFL